MRFKNRRNSWILIRIFWRYHRYLFEDIRVDCSKYETSCIQVSLYTHSPCLLPRPRTLLVMRHSDARVASPRVVSRVLPSTPREVAAIVRRSVGQLDSSRNAPPLCALTHPFVTRVRWGKGEWTSETDRRINRRTEREGEQRGKKGKARNVRKQLFVDAMRRKHSLDADSARAAPTPAPVPVDAVVASVSASAIAAVAAVAPTALLHLLAAKVASMKIPPLSWPRWVRGIFFSRNKMHREGTRHRGLVDLRVRFFSRGNKFTPIWRPAPTSSLVISRRSWTLVGESRRSGLSYRDCD